MSELHPNKPCTEGAALGEQLARLTSLELAAQKKKCPNHKEPCGTCAFRLGTYPNRCLATVLDALKCVMEHKDFYCHESHKLCTGWMIALGTVWDKPPVKMPWEFDNGGEVTPPQ